MQRISVPNMYGYKVLRMTAWRGRGLAITRSAENCRRWTITHISSGRRMTSIRQNLSLRKARTIASILVKAMDWRQFPDDPWNLPESVQAQVLGFTDAVAEMFEAT